MRKFLQAVIVLAMIGLPCGYVAKAQTMRRFFSVINEGELMFDGIVTAWGYNDEWDYHYPTAVDGARILMCSDKIDVLVFCKIQTLT